MSSKDQGRRSAREGWLLLEREHKRLSFPKTWGRVGEGAMMFTVLRVHTFLDMNNIVRW